MEMIKMSCGSRKKSNKLQTRIRRNSKYFYFKGEHSKKKNAQKHKKEILKKFPKHNVRIIERTRINKNNN